MINCLLVKTVLGLRLLYPLANAVADANDLVASLAGHTLGVSTTGYGRGRHPTAAGGEHQRSGTVGTSAICCDGGSRGCAEGGANAVPAGGSACSKDDTKIEYMSTSAVNPTRASRANLPENAAGAICGVADAVMYSATGPGFGTGSDLEA